VPILKTGLKTRQGHIDEVPGAGFQRPVGGWCWELRRGGDPQGHVGVDPSSAETYCCGSLRELWGRQNLSRGQQAADSVARLE